MDPQLAKYLMLGAVFFGAFVVVPVVMAMLSHQQKMTQLLNKTNSDAEDLRALLERVEHKLDALGAATKPAALEKAETERTSDQVRPMF